MNETDILCMTSLLFIFLNDFGRGIRNVNILTSNFIFLKTTKHHWYEIVKIVNEYKKTQIG